MIQVIVLDKHAFNDERIRRHLKFLLQNNYTVFSINFNRYESSLAAGEYTRAGEKAYRINLFPVPKFMIPSVYYNWYCMSSKITGDAITVLKNLHWDMKEITIVHVHDPSLLPLGKWLSKKYPKVSLVYDRHEVYESPVLVAKRIKVPRNGRFFEWIARDAIRGIIVVAEGHKESCQKLFPDAEIITVPNFPDSSEYDISTYCFKD